MKLINIIFWETDVVKPKLVDDIRHAMRYGRERREKSFRSTPPFGIAAYKVPSA
jgi:hypothetical protein